VRASRLHVVSSQTKIGADVDMFLREEGQIQIVSSDKEIEARECEDTMIAMNGNK
jgi:hypothetical protein